MKKIKKKIMYMKDNNCNVILINILEKRNMLNQKLFFYIGNISDKNSIYEKLR